MEKVKPWLGEPQNTIAVLQKYGFVFQKKYGQNFLIDPHVLDKIVAAAGIGPDDFVVEIGPGIGTLTQYLAYAARSVCAVEIDKNLIPILEDTLSDYDNVEVINNDVLKVDLAALAKEKNNGRPIKVVANLPPRAAPGPQGIPQRHSSISNDRIPAVVYSFSLTACKIRCPCF